MDRDEQAAVLHGEAKRVAEGLGAGWKYVEPDPDGEWRWVAEVEHDSGRRLVLQLDKGRVEVRPSYRHEGRNFSPWDAGVIPYGKPGPHATYQVGRDAEAVARQLQRSVVTPYIAIWDASLARKKERQERDAMVQKLGQELAALVGGSVSFAEHDHEARLWFNQGTARVLYDGTVRIETTSLPAADAARVLKALMGVEN